MAFARGAAGHGGGIGQRGRMEQYDLSIPALPNAQESPHPLAGEALLRDAGVPEGIASIVGAHHGRTAKLKPDFDVYQLKCLCENYWGRGEGAGWRQVQAQYLNWALAGSGFISAIGDTVTPSASYAAFTRGQSPSMKTFVAPGSGARK